MAAIIQEQVRPSSSQERAQAQQVTVAYMMSRFPKLTETFILFEMLAVAEQGASVEVYPLMRHKTDVMHPEAAPFVQRAHFAPFISASILRANASMLWRKPRAYLGALRDLLKGNLGSLRYFAGAVAFFPKSVYFAWHMKARGVTHIHAHFASHPAAAAFAIHRLTGIPYSFTAHGSDIHRDRTMLAEKVAEASFVVPISDFNKAVILDACDGQFGEKMTVIHCGVDTRRFKPRPGESNGSQPASAPPQRPLHLCCVGTLHEVKGQRFLIEACRLLRERGVDWRCHFVGDGPDREALMQQSADSGVSDWVTFHGRKTRDEVVALLQEADVVVAPSVPSSDGRREGIPVALMEAMATGVPVVASRLSGIPELVEDGVSGLLTPPGDALALAEALQRLWREPALRRRLGQAARVVILEEFDLTTNAARLAARFTVKEIS